MFYNTLELIVLKRINKELNLLFFSACSIQHNPVCPVAPKIATFSTALDMINIITCKYYATANTRICFSNSISKAKKYYVRNLFRNRMLTCKVLWYKVYRAVMPVWHFSYITENVEISIISLD